jgi:hypothetical protein
LQEKEAQTSSVRQLDHLYLPIDQLTRNIDNEKQKDILLNDPKKYLAYRKKIESELNSRFRFILNGSQEQAEARVVSYHSFPV